MPAFFPHSNGRIVFWAVVVLLLPSSSAAGPANGSIESPPPQQVSFGVDVTIETISVAVTDASGGPVTGLTAADFVVEEDGLERPISFVLPADNAPIDVALVLDLSGSMGSSSWRQRTLAFLQALSPQRDCVLLLRFSRTVSTSVWGRPGDADLVAAIEGSFVGGATSLYDALIEGVHRLAPFADDVGLGMGGGNSAPGGGDGGECPAPSTGASDDPAAHRRTAIVAITDGIDSSSGHSMYQVELVTEAAGVPIFQIELTSGGRSTVTMRRTAPRMANPDNALKVGQQRRGGFGDRRQQPVIDFQRLVSVSGGDSFRSGPEAYTQLLERLRGSYIVGYQLSPGDAGPSWNEYTRHEIEVALPSRRVTVLHRPYVYRPTFDRVRAQAELDEGIRQLYDQQFAASLAAFQRSIDAHPSFPDPHAWGAQALLWEEGIEPAVASAVRATELAPSNGNYHLLVSDLASQAGQYELAWEHAIRGAQAGVATTFEFDALAESAPAPVDIRERLDAPRVAVLAAPPTQVDLIVRAALPTAIRGIARALSEHPRVALVPDPRTAHYLLWVFDRNLSSEPPRRFEGRLVLTDPAGETVYEKDIRFDDLDDYGENAEELARRVGEILEKTSAPGR